MDPGIWGALTMLLHIYPDVMPAKSKGSLHGSSYGCIVVASAGPGVLQPAYGSELPFFRIVSVLFRRVFEIVLQLTYCILVG